MNNNLVYIDHKLTLITETERHIYIDFESHELLRRVQQGAKSNSIIKALGLNKKKGYVIDTTAGFGTDAFIASAFGGNVIMCERSPIMSQLLEDALTRANSSSISIVKNIASRMQLKPCNAVDALSQLAQEYNPICIYLDPMYPERNKSALGKIKMREILAIVGDDLDAHLLFSQAKQLSKRIVVKRPKLAPTITKTQPSMNIIGNSTRFDIYINH
ncbi:MAG: class I SAM-dependent methyltransferase [Francisellaceae bacterium]|jgi:16S rRNA (guanine1516-N2)-methyltransferase|nr:class I SAM-dependent methyltransferase [Francisellaceae bacterium]MBT6538403.1 class I SAM-dependent methyltransferase [Francisellaceae bacterium]